MMRDVISHQLGSMPHRLDSFMGCSRSLNPGQGSASGAAVNVGNSGAPLGVGGAGSGVGVPAGNPGVNVGAAGVSPPGSHSLSLKRPNEENLEEDEEEDDANNNPPVKKLAIDGSSSAGLKNTPQAVPVTSVSVGASGSQDSPGVSASAGIGINAACTGVMTAASNSSAKAENGVGASLPAVAAPPSSNLMMPSAVFNAPLTMGKDLVARLNNELGGHFEFVPKYTHVRSEQSGNGGSSNGDQRASAAQGSSFQEVIARLKAVRPGEFVAFMDFDVAGNRRPCNVNIVSWSESSDTDVGATDGDSATFVGSVEGLKAAPTSKHTVFQRVSAVAYQVSFGSPE